MALGWVVATLSLAAGGCGTPAPSEPPAAYAPAPAAPREATPDLGATRIVFLGDSLSAGYGLAESEAFPALVEEGLRAEGRSVTVVNSGVSGDTTAGGLARLDWVLRLKPDLLVVELGANDALRGQSLENTERNLREIVRRGGEAGARVLLLGMDVPTSYGRDYAGAFAELYERIARDEQVEFLPGFIREVGTDPALMQRDALHPTAAGHRRLAADLLPPLGRMLDEAR